MANAQALALVADIGGTNARFALADTSLEAPLQQDSIREFAVADFPSLGDAARHYLEQVGASATRGVFAVAGRVDGDEARITNHPWVISRSRTAHMLGFDELHLINDFAAQAMAGADEIYVLGGIQAIGAMAIGTEHPVEDLAARCGWSHLGP